MSKVTLQGDVNGTGTVTIAAPNTNTNRTVALPDSSGTAVVADTPTASTANTVTHKIPVVIGGTTYYLLASTSGA